MDTNIYPINPSSCITATNSVFDYYKSAFNKLFTQFISSSFDVFKINSLLEIIFSDFDIDSAAIFGNQAKLDADRFCLKGNNIEIIAIISNRNSINLPRRIVNLQLIKKALRINDDEPFKR